MKKAIRNRTAIFIILALCCLNYSAFTQQSSSPSSQPKGKQEDEELKLRLKMGEEIIEKARKAIYKGIKPEDVKTVYFRTEGKTLDELSFDIPSIPLSEKQDHYVNTQDHYFIEFPSKLKIIRKEIYEEGPAYTKGERRESMEIFDKGKYFSNTLKFDDSNTIYKPQTEANPSKNRKEFVWQEIFSILFLDTSQQERKFKYIGKAKTPDGNRADTIEIHKKKEKNPSQIKLFFDEKKHLLLMATLENSQNYSFEAGDDHNGSEKIKRSLYFSNRAEIEGILIPRTIQMVEQTVWDYKHRIIEREDIKSLNEFLVIRNIPVINTPDDLAVAFSGKNIQKYTKEVKLTDFKINPTFERNTFKFKKK